MATLYRIPQYRTTTLAVPGNVDNSQTTGIILADLPADLDVDVAGILALTWSNPVDEDAIEYITYTSINSGTKELQGVTRGQEGFSARAHNNGATVAWVISKSHINNVVDKLSGTDTALAVDTSGNEFIKTSKTTSAVNEITVKNAATGTGPEIQATGGDTNIDLVLQPKGTGAAVVKGTATSAAELRLNEDTDNGTNYIGLKAPASVGTSKTFTLPDADGSANQVLKTDGSANLGWATAGSTDGWTASSDTWTYASASTFTIAGVDRTTTFTKGTRLKFTQTSAKYAVVVSSSFSTDTTVTIAVNTDYTIANAAITSPYYSYEVNPQGYPLRFAYTPSLTNITLGNGTLTFTFAVIGSKVFVTGRFVMGSTSSISGVLTFSLPVTINTNLTNYYQMGCSIDDYTTTEYTGIVVQASTTTVGVYVSNSSATYLQRTATSSTVPMTWVTSDECRFQIMYDMA